MTNPDNSPDPPEETPGPLDTVPDVDPPGPEETDLEGDDFRLGTAPDPLAAESTPDIDDLEAEFEWIEPQAVGNPITHKESGNVWTDFSEPGRQKFLRTISESKLRGIVMMYRDRSVECIRRATAADTALKFLVSEGNK